MTSIALLASSTNIGIALVIAAIAIGGTLRISALVHGKKAIFPKR